MTDLQIEEEGKKLTDNDAQDSDAIERIIQEVGEMGTYQKLLFLCMLPYFFSFIAVYSLQIFVSATPQDHWCRVPELQHLDIDLRRNLSIPGAVHGPDWDKCRVYDANWTLVLQTMTPPSGTPTKPCDHGWEFLYEDIPYATVVSEREWVCDQASNAPFAQSVFFMGSLVGCAVFGWAGDKYGRLPALIASNLMGSIGGLLLVFTRGVWDYAFASFLLGMPVDCCVVMIVLIVLEYVGPSHRTWVSNMSIALYSGGGCLVMVLLALWFNNWRNLVLATTLPMALVLLTPLYIPESARWLASKGKVNKAVKMLRRFEKINKKKISEESLSAFVTSTADYNKEEGSLKLLSKTPSLRNGLLVLIAVGMCGNLTLDAVLRMSENIGTSFFMTFALSSFMEIPALILVTLILERVGRRLLIVTTLMVAGVASLVCSFTSHGLIQLILALCTRFFVNMAISIHFQLTSEMMPTALRARGNAIVHLTVYVAMIPSPYIVYSARFWAPLPLLIMGGLCLSAAALSLLLPETAGRPFPQTIHDAETLNRETKLFRKSKKTTNSAPKTSRKKENKQVVLSSIILNKKTFDFDGDNENELRL